MLCLEVRERDQVRNTSIAILTTRIDFHAKEE